MPPPRRLIFAAILFLVPFLALEVLVRLTFPRYADADIYLGLAVDQVLNSGVRVDRNAESYHPRFGGLFTPHREKVVETEEYRYTIRTNSLGFRTNELQARKPGEYRVLFFGDSMLFGVGVEAPETASAVLEQLGRELPGPHRLLSVYDYSIGGYDTVQELLVARTFARPVAPDLIVLGFLTANDVVPNALSFISAERNYTAREEGLERLKAEIRDSLSVCFHSVICRVVALKAYMPRFRYSISSRPEIIGESYALLEQFQVLAREMGARLVVVVIPSRDAVEGGLVQAWSGSRKISELLVDFCASHGIESIDLLDFMQGREARRRYFYPRDGHFTREGQALVARAIFERVVRERILAARPD